jgi:hypothetical protein
LPTSAVGIGANRIVGFQPWALWEVPLPPPLVAAEAVVHPTTGNATATSPLSGAVDADVAAGVVEADGARVVDEAPRRELPQPVRAAPATTITLNPPSLDSPAPNPCRCGRPARCSVVTVPDDKPPPDRTGAAASSRVGSNGIGEGGANPDGPRCRD